MRRLCLIAHAVRRIAFDAHAALVVCADPNNMPFSNRHEARF